MTDIISTKSGMQDGLNSVNVVAQWAQKLSLSSASKQIAQKVSKKFGLAADSLFLFDFLNDSNRLQSSVKEVFATRKIEPLRNSAYYFVSCIASCGESLKFICGVIGKVALAPLVVGTSAASICKMVVDLTGIATSYTQEKAQLAFLKVAQTITFISVESFVIVGALCTTISVATPILAGLSLGLSLNYAIYRWEAAIELPVEVPA